MRYARHVTLAEQLLKTAAVKKPVKGYIRRVDGHAEVVRPYQRTEDEKPVDGVTEERGAKDLRLWLKWKVGGYKHEDLRPLLKSLEPVIQGEARKFKTSGLRIPPSVIDLEFQRQAVVALKTYDPTRGTKISSHVTNLFIKTRRFIAANRNIARIPESRIYLVRDYQVAQERLEEDLGRIPTDVEMSGYLKWPVKQVATLSTELRKDMWSHSDKWEDDPNSSNPTEQETVLKLIKYELNPDEKTVYYHFVEKGETSTTEIGRLTGFDLPKVSRLKSQIATKLEQYLK